MTWNWIRALERIRDGEPTEDVLDEMLAWERADVREWFVRNAPGQVAFYDQQMRDVDLGLTRARNVWHSISPAQRRALQEASRHGGRLDRVGKEYRHVARHQPYRPIYVATVRNLCARDLMAWDGGVFDPEAAAVVSERGRFVLAYGGEQ